MKGVESRIAVVKPAALKPGDTIGLLGFSGPTTAERLAAGAAVLEKLGFKLQVALDPCREYGRATYLFSSDSAVARAAALHGFIRDPAVRAVISVRGAYGSLELLPLLDFDCLRKNPKIIMGFSDLTGLLAAICDSGGLVAIHGPSLESIGRSSVDAAAEAALTKTIALLTGKLQQPFADVRLDTLKAGPLGTGRLIGGNLSLLASLMGTPWEPDLSGKILFFEEVAERPYRIHRMLLQLKLAGKLERLSGVLIGYLTKCEHPAGAGADCRQVLDDIFGDYDYPVLTGAPVGHEPYNVAVPLGVSAIIGDNRLELLEEAVLS